MSYDNTVTIEIAAEHLHMLTALAGGYSMIHGRYITQQWVRDAQQLLWQSGYENHADTPFPEISEWYYETYVKKSR